MFLIYLFCTLLSCASSNKKNFINSIQVIEYTHLPEITGGVLTNFTANKNCIAHTSKQHKFRDNDRAHSASVTS